MENDIIITESEQGKLITFTLIDNDLRNILSELLDNDEVVYETEHKIPLARFLNKISIIKTKVETGEYRLLSLLILLNEEYESKLKSINVMMEDNKTTFENLNNIFSVGKQFVTLHENMLIGSIVNKTKLININNIRCFRIDGNFYTSRNGKIKIIQESFIIPEFRGTKNINSLSVRPPTDNDIKLLSERGQKFVELCNKPINYMSYKGTMFRKTQYGPFHFNANGRIMIDSLGFQQNLPNYIYDESNAQETKEILPDFYFMCWPTLLGFSFNAKQWGEIFVDNVSQIKFNDNAFNTLVLDNKTKNVIKALVMNNENTFTDIIDGKSGGCIFLLHGSPGVGKTLTCEAVSELLHRPLYSVGVGELGSDSHTLEKKLNSIIELAHSWNAIILIDECDIFMESRNTSDVVRNAMVAIFLRLLERHQGVMFLTTNRINTMDEAFKSRISMILKYDNFDIETRMKIWKNLSNVSGIDISDNDIKQLSEINLNGRQIKSAIRMAQCIAKSENRQVDCKLLLEYINYLE